MVLPATVHPFTPPNPAGAVKSRRCWAWVNAKTMEFALDPIFLLLSLGISVSAIVVGCCSLLASVFAGGAGQRWGVGARGQV